MPVSFRVPECPPGCVCVCEDPTGSGTASSDGSGAASSESGAPSTGAMTAESGAGEVSTGAGQTSIFPQPTAPCPTIQTGTVNFCPAGFPCRDVRFTSVESTTGTGPLVLAWAGTFNNPDTLVGSDFATDLLISMADAEGGMVALPYPDPGAVSRPDTPFPWWVVCGFVNPSQCDRLDDFALADEIVACSIEQGLIDPDRISSAGGSAGGIMTTHLVNRVPWLAGAVSWSGGVSTANRPVDPPDESTVAVMAIHGGPTDQYCGPGVGNCYGFVGPTEALAEDLTTDGRWLLLCDHNTGHHNAMGPQVDDFVRLANRAGHPWEGSVPGSMGNWVLDNYCYTFGDPSPWAQ